MIEYTTPTRPMTPAEFEAGIEADQFAGPLSDGRITEWLTDDATIRRLIDMMPVDHNGYLLRAYEGYLDWTEQSAVDPAVAFDYAGIYCRVDAEDYAFHLIYHLGTMATLAFGLSSDSGLAKETVRGASYSDAPGYSFYFWSD